MFLGTITAFIWTVTGCEEEPRTNQTACQDYVETVNDTYRSCGEEVPFDEDSECPEILNLPAIDCTTYFDCLGGAYWCDEEEGKVHNDHEECEVCVEL